MKLQPEQSGRRKKKQGKIEHGMVDRIDAKYKNIRFEEINYFESGSGGREF